MYTSRQGVCRGRARSQLLSYIFSIERRAARSTVKETPAYYCIQRVDKSAKELLSARTAALQTPTTMNLQQKRSIPGR